MNIKYRFIRENEYPFLKEMLYEALFVPPSQPKFPASIIEVPEIAKYINSWEQGKSDIAIVAVHDDELLGAVWGRKFEESNKGYGFVDEATPEISMAVKPEFRNKGIGTSLLNQIESEFAKIGIITLSLSVNKLNPAKQLYERCGYEIFQEEETAVTMMKEIRK
ncbi:MAG: GNAT family N-acetyltransferase [Bacteroidota bacterium]